MTTTFHINWFFFRYSLSLHANTVRSIHQIPISSIGYILFLTWIGRILRTDILSAFIYGFSWIFLSGDTNLVGFRNFAHINIICGLDKNVVVHFYRKSNSCVTKTNLWLVIGTVCLYRKPKTVSYTHKRSKKIEEKRELTINTLPLRLYVL